MIHWATWCDGSAEVRRLEAFELMRLIGWNVDSWAPYSTPDKAPDLELISNLAGNAYSLYHYGPWEMAALATFGKYHKDHGGKPHASILVAASSDDEASRTSSSSYSCGSRSD